MFASLRRLLKRKRPAGADKAQHQSAEAHYREANALNRVGRLEEAVAAYDKAISLNPSYAHAFCNRGSALERLGQLEEALCSYDSALGLDSTDALAHYNRGTLLIRLKRLPEALADFDSAVAINPRYSEAYVNRGNVLQELLRHEAAIDSFSHAIEHNPRIAEAFVGRGTSKQRLKRLREALSDYGSAIALRPEFVAALRSRAELLAGFGHHREAAEDYLQVIRLAPAADIYQSLSFSLLQLMRVDDAMQSLDKAAELDPEMKFLLGSHCGARTRANLWDGLEEDRERIAIGIRARKVVCHPMILASLIDSPPLLHTAAKLFVEDQVGEPSDSELRALPVLSGSRVELGAGRLRLGYFSADFRTHPVSHLAVGMFENHDRDRFEITAFAFGPEVGDPIVARLTKAFDRFVDIRQRSDVEVATLARQLGIDIAVDLNGFTEHSRTRIFALRAAPIQANFLGYPGTLGANFMDYLIADGTVIPRSQQMHYAEKIAYLPDSFLPFDSSYAIAERDFAREELGLPTAGFVFCCFNNNYKILPEIFERWMRILLRTEGSVLWLRQADETARKNLRQEAARRDVDPDRLIFAGRVAALPEHVARIRAADLFLDTLPYGAHATAMDVLWAGVPLLTCAGASFASRVAASLLRTAGLGDLVTSSLAEYEEMAVSLAAEPKRLSAVRGNLRRRETVLFDTQRYTRNIESIYEAMYERHLSGGAPEHVNESFASANAASISGN